MPKLNENQVPS